MASKEQISGAILLGLLSFNEAEELVALYSVQIQDERRRREFLRDFKKAVETGQGALVRLADHLHIKPRDTQEFAAVSTTTMPVPDGGVILSMAEFIQDVEALEKVQEEERLCNAKTIPKMSVPPLAIIARMDLNRKGVSRGQ